MSEPHPLRIFWTPDDSRCEPCGAILPAGIPTEMRYPDGHPLSHLSSVICCAPCGTAAGLEPA